MTLYIVHAATPSSVEHDMSKREHWEEVYATKPAAEVSWYTPHLRSSVERIAGATEATARVIDVGAGASTLVDDLLELGYAGLTVLDISDSALATTRNRLGHRASSVQWVVSDVLAAKLPKASFDLWHDRAVFHFLVEAVDRQAYLDVLRHSLSANGTVVIATFSLNGPSRCSGLNVVRYSALTLAEQFGADFDLVSSAEETHATPSGAQQRFVVCEFKRRS